MHVLSSEHFQNFDFSETCLSLGMGFGDNVGSLALMGTHVVVARPNQKMSSSLIFDRLLVMLNFAEDSWLHKFCASDYVEVLIKGTTYQMYQGHPALPKLLKCQH